MRENYTYPPTVYPPFASGEATLSAQSVHSLLNRGNVALLQELESEIPAAILKDFLSIYFGQKTVRHEDMYVKLKKFSQAFTSEAHTAVVNEHVFYAVFMVDPNQEASFKITRNLYMNDLSEAFLEGFLSMQKTNPHMTLPYEYCESIYSAHYFNRDISAVPKEIPVLLFSVMAEDDIHKLFQEHAIFSMPRVTEFMHEAAAHRIPLEWLQNLYPNSYNPFHGR